MKKKVLLLIIMTLFLVGCSKVSYRYREFIKNNDYNISVEVPRNWEAIKSDADVDTGEYDNSLNLSHEKSSANISANMTEIINSKDYEIKYFKKQAKEVKKQNKTTTDVEEKQVGLYTVYYYKYNEDNFENIDCLVFIDKKECIQISGYANLDENIKSDDIRKDIFRLINSIIIEEENT
ncbi:MAG: hypothetical protein IKG58_01650 [Bacilli bacterium]|nr:hypothetical protein [Bacilli bacterium]MBR3049250.1 hypothetical protein [Bacilli bacterium]